MDALFCPFTIPPSLVRQYENIRQPVVMWFGRAFMKISANGLCQKLTNYLIENWESLVFFVIALTVIISGTGLMYGFKAVALPLLYGMGGGLVIGGITGLITVFWIDPQGEIKPNTFWGLTNTYLNKLNPNGIRPIVIAIAVPVILAVTVVTPAPMGIGFGFIIGNHVVTAIGHQKELSLNEDKATNHPVTIEELQRKVDDLERQVQSLRPRHTISYNDDND